MSSDSHFDSNNDVFSPPVNVSNKFTVEMGLTSTLTSTLTYRMVKDQAILMFSSSVTSFKIFTVEIAHDLNLDLYNW